MINRVTVVKIRDYVLSRTWEQLQALTKQDVIDYFAGTPEPLTDTLIAELKRFRVINWLKGEWLAVQEDEFINNRYLPAFRSAINPSLSSFTVNEVYEYTLTQGLSEETALRIYKKAVSVYHGEVR